MASKKSYGRFFIIFQEEDKGYGIAIDKQPTGYTKIETRNGKCKLTVYAQNLVKEKGPYTCCLVDASKNPLVTAELGEISIDETGRGETWWEYKEDDIAGTGVSVDRFNVSAVIAKSNNIKAPLAGYIGKDKVEWKDRFSMNRSNLSEDKITEDLKIEVKIENEISEEGLKFKEYEEKIKEQIEELTGEKEDFNAKDKFDDIDMEEIRDSLNNEKQAGIIDNYRDDKDESYAKKFHEILEDYVEDYDITEEMKNAKWWKIPWDGEMDIKNQMLYPYYCTVLHLKMTYPYINYVKYFKKPGHYHFGIQYDDDGEVKYIIYGIEGYNTPQDQPYKGTTGFLKWIKHKDKDTGMWIMCYNPYTGRVMIPKK